jgi:hypothetical protein
MYLLIIVEILKNSDRSCQTAFVHLPIISRAYHIVVDKLRRCAYAQNRCEHRRCLEPMKIMPLIQSKTSQNLP